jgi:hypothetical protein
VERPGARCLSSVVEHLIRKELRYEASQKDRGGLIF